MNSGRIFFLSLLCAGASALDQSQVEANKKVVFDFYRFVWEPRNLKALETFIPESYIEHNPRFNGKRIDLVNALKGGTLSDWSRPGKV